MRLNRHEIHNNVSKQLNQKSAEKTKTEKLAVCKALLITQYK